VLVISTKTSTCYYYFLCTFSVFRRYDYYSWVILCFSSFFWKFKSNSGFVCFDTYKNWMVTEKVFLMCWEVIFVWTAYRCPTIRKGSWFLLLDLSHPDQCSFSPKFVMFAQMELIWRLFCQIWQYSKYQSSFHIVVDCGNFGRFLIKISFLAHSVSE
jgi:hypothetical protein